jgi:hypothetical protein
MCRILGANHVVFRPLDETRREDELREEILQDPKFREAKMREVLVYEPYPELGKCYEVDFRV